MLSAQGKYLLRFVRIRRSIRLKKLMTFQYKVYMHKEVLGLSQKFLFSLTSFETFPF